jgi:hypothetical protein
MESQLPGGVSREDRGRYGRKGCAKFLGASRDTESDRNGRKGVGYRGVHGFAAIPIASSLPEHKKRGSNEETATTLLLLRRVPRCPEGMIFTGISPHLLDIDSAVHERGWLHMSSSSPHL